MTIIADSGSTKTDWRIVNGVQEVRSVSTIGFNPVLVDTDLIIKELRKEFKNHKQNEAVETIYYYGAGCWNKKSGATVRKALTKIFPKASIQVKSDMLGAARAVCGKQAGIACILGTGANSCLYNGKKITDNITALGYILGDEGSGADLGKRLLQSYFYRELPESLREKLQQEYLVSKKKLFKKIYRGKKNSRYLARFAQFVIEEKDHPFIEKLIIDAFDAFIERQLLKYKKAETLPIHFIGSVAYFLQTILIQRLEQHQLKIGKIIRQPIDGLVTYHI